MAVLRDNERQMLWAAVRITHKCTARTTKRTVKEDGEMEADVLRALIQRNKQTGS